MKRNRQIPHIFLWFPFSSVSDWYQTYLLLVTAPSTRRSTTRLPTTTTALTTTTAVLPTTAMITPELTSRTPLQTRTTTALTTVATTCPPATSAFLSEATTVLPTTELSTEGTILTAGTWYIWPFFPFCWSRVSWSLETGFFLLNGAIQRLALECVCVCVLVC